MRLFIFLDLLCVASLAFQGKNKINNMIPFGRGTSSITKYNAPISTSFFVSPTHKTTLKQSSSANNNAESSRFGKLEYWNDFYEQSSNFSWYAGWEQLSTTINTYISNTSFHILLPGIGNDRLLVDMYDAGYKNLTAMDYAPEGIARCYEMLGPQRSGVNLVVADARNLENEFSSETFDAVLEKGTLDAIYLGGITNSEVANEATQRITAQLYLEEAIHELGRTVKPGGIWMSVAAVVVDEIQDVFQNMTMQWQPLVLKKDKIKPGWRDGTLLVWRKVEG